MGQVSKLAGTALLQSLIATTAIADNAIWTTPTSGSLSGNAITVSYSASGGSLENFDFTGSDFVYQPIAAAANVPGVENDDDITVTFATPVTDPLFYARYMRGTACSGTGLYTFTYKPNAAAAPQPITPIVRSGFDGSTPSAGQLNLGSSGYYSGILSFPGTIQELTISSDCTGGSGNYIFTFADEAAPAVVAAAPVPTLSQWGMLIASALLGLLSFGALRRMRG